MKYLGMTFKNYDELKAWVKQGKLNEYRKLAKLAVDNLTMELNAMMSDLASELMSNYGVSADEIESIELEALALA